MLRSQELKKKSRIAFEWVLKANGAVMKAETKVRADHAKSRGVPLPDELAATIASYPLQMAACRAVKQCLDSAEQSVYEDLQCTYRGVVDKVTGEVLENCKPKNVSLVAFEWVLMTNGNIMKAVTHVRADNAKTRGVPIPDELVAHFASCSLQKVARRAVERYLDSADGASKRSPYEELQCTYRGVVDEVTGEVFENRNPKTVSLVAFEWMLHINGAIMKAVTHVRADDAQNQRVPLPKELDAAVEKVLLWQAASSAAEGVTREVVDKNLLKDVECQYSAGIFLI